MSYRLAASLPCIYTSSVFRVGILDLIAVALVAVVLLLPGREFLVEAPYEQPAESDMRILLQAQALLTSSPTDGAQASRLADVLRRLDQHQEAIRFAGDSLEHGGGWRAALAVSTAHADRVEVQPALAYATKALAECDANRKACSTHERLRISLYESGMQAGLDSGIDPRLQPQEFRNKVLKSLPSVRIR